jgi:hypothetical protein
MYVTGPAGGAGTALAQSRETSVTLEQRLINIGRPVRAAARGPWISASGSFCWQKIVGKASWICQLRRSGVPKMSRTSGEIEKGESLDICGSASATTSQEWVGHGLESGAYAS